MAFKNFLKNKSLEDLKDDILLSAFEKSGFGKNSPSFNTIRCKVLEDGLNATTILEMAEQDILNEFELSQEEDKERFLKMRAVLYKTIILKNAPISDLRLKRKIVENFSKDEIYQLLEEKIKSNCDSQSQKWYSFIERESMTGICFVEYNENDLAKNLDLTGGQKIALSKLIEKMNPQDSQRTTIKARNGAFGVIGDAKVSIGGNMKVYKGSNPSVKGTPSSRSSSSSEDSS